MSRSTVLETAPSVLVTTGPALGIRYVLSQSKKENSGVLVIEGRGEVHAGFMLDGCQYCGTEHLMK
jgi:hypothetical protein